MPAFERPPIVGHIDIFEGERIEGWVVDLDHPQRPALLRVMIDDEAVDSVLCALLREDVKQSGLPSAEAGFLYFIPPLYHDGLRHTLQFRTLHGAAVHFRDALGQGWDLTHFCLARQTQVEGMVEGLDGGAVKGWAVRSDLAGASRRGGVVLRVSADGRPVGEVRADLFRPDVAETLGAEPDCGFRFVPPPELRHGQEVRLVFQAVPEGTELANSPLAVRFLATDAYATLARVTREIDRLAGELWVLRGQLRALAAAPSCAIEEYAAWAGPYFADLRRRFAEQVPAADGPPTVSVLCRLDRPHFLDLAAAVDSVRAQTRGDWELLLIDDAAATPEIAAALEAWQESDPRIRVLPAGGAPARDVARALAAAKGAYVAFLRQDDRLVDVALAAMLQAAETSGANLLYSDEDRISPAGRLEAPLLKPGWNRRLLLSRNYLGGLLLVRRQDAAHHWPAKGRSEGAECYGLALRIAESAGPGEIRHVPEILCHSARRGELMPTLADAAAVTEHLRRRRTPGEAVPGTVPGGLRVSWSFRKEPAVALLLPFRERIPEVRRCVEALRAHTRYDLLEIVLVDGWSASADAEAFAAEMARGPRTRVLAVRQAGPRPALLNRAAAATTAEYLLVFAPALLAIRPDWLRGMVDEALADPAVGLVGGRVIEPGGRVRAGAAVVGVGGGAVAAHHGLAANAPGYLAGAACAQEVAGHLGGAALLRREAFASAGGYEEAEEFAPLADLDLSLKLRRAGFRLVWTPESTLELAPGGALDHEGDPQALARARQAMRGRWGEDLGGDPFYHPFFAREAEPYRRLVPL